MRPKLEPDVETTLKAFMKKNKCKDANDAIKLAFQKLQSLQQPQPITSDVPMEKSEIGSGPRPMPLQNPIIKAYLRQKGIQDAKTEGAIERAKAKEQLHQQFEAERLETEYKTWKKKQEEKQRRQPQRECGIDMGDSAGVPDDYIF
jgi:hypothetical protein